ncbi:formylglycine-generating enzyme family protein [Aerolutibacter ruishenii]|uniref:Formylglycine-generating enzyme required for sulfatase activity n=1 Tax=Aerolutibacter ruishenii TaxID=686800 RepID=A0A562LW63_9GAMM|nr:formylglycine-generating enzyme family protein [Lysobacter ruishenii]TWI11897.1 formylglycine-generating enzyme required for sulfatase activity [Lysobacter ruishenii]
MRGFVVVGMVATLLLAGCSREQGDGHGRAADSPAKGPHPLVTVSEDQAVSPVGPWHPAAVEVTDANAASLAKQAEAALGEGNLYADSHSALPILLALARHAPSDNAVAAALSRATRALLQQGDTALAAIDSDPDALRGAHEVAAVARSIAPADEAVQAYLGRVDRAEAAANANRSGERALVAGEVGEDGKAGALQQFRQALQWRPGDARAQQGLAAAESQLIRRAEQAAEKHDYAAAERWLGSAGKVRGDLGTVDHARAQIAQRRAARIRELRDLAIAALAKEDGLDVARGHLASLLRIAPSGDPAAVELRQRIELASHYGMFRPGQVFTEALRNGGRGPQMVVVPHGAFRMGAAEGEPDATDAEYPARNIRFDRGVALARTEVTVDEFGRFVAATGYRSRAERRGYSTAYDERSGNLVRRSRVDWRSDYAGKPAAGHMPVLHVSWQDAHAYAEWLAEQTGQRYRLPSEAEFEYALRATSVSRFPWPGEVPPPGAGNFTGGKDESPSGRKWRNAFKGYGDDAWGPALVGGYSANAFGLHDLAGNVSEWVADCWHDTYRRAPDDGQAWVNPGCRAAVVRGGSWASSPAQTRSAWRLGSDRNTTNARVGFRVAREI